MQRTRRELCLLGTKLAGVLALGPTLACRSAPLSSRPEESEEPLFKISLAQWSLHRALQAGELSALEFPAYSSSAFDIQAVEYVNSFFKDKAGDFRWLAELKQRAEDVGVRSVLIMIDGEGSLAADDEKMRRRAIDKHFKWIAAAKYLGCHSIRVNARGVGDWKADMERAADSLVRLGVMGEDYGIDVIVENHGGLSSNGEWLSGVMRTADHPRVGTLPDFGNFRIAEGEVYDRYKGVTELMPFAKAVSAKSNGFDEKGNETQTDYLRMLRIVLAAGYRGHVGVEWEGGGVSEPEGVRLTRDLLIRVRDELALELA